MDIVFRPLGGCLILSLLAVGGIGCHPLAPGRLEAVQPASMAVRSGNVYLIRGWRDLYSEGIDRLAEQLRQKGLHSEAFRAAQWRDLANVIAEKYSFTADREPLILVGFSYGADDTLRISEELQKRHLNVDLVITIDPVTAPPVPANVQRCVNYFQTNGMMDVFPWLRGTPLKADAKTRLLNVDIRRDRPDLLEPDTAHWNIAANRKIQAAVLRDVLQACPPREPTVQFLGPSTRPQP